jgi:hypothetical protein
MNPSQRPSRNSLLLSLSLLFVLLLPYVSAQTTYEGCYSVDNTLVANDTSIYQSKGRCSGEICGPMKYAVFGLSGSQCFCGNSIPSNQVTPDQCQQQCPGYPNDTCTSPLLGYGVNGRRWDWIFQCLVDGIGEVTRTSSFEDSLRCPIRDCYGSKSIVPNSLRYSWTYHHPMTKLTSRNYHHCYPDWIKFGRRCIRWSGRRNRYRSSRPCCDWRWRIHSHPSSTKSRLPKAVRKFVFRIVAGKFTSSVCA